MKVEQVVWTSDEGWGDASEGGLGDSVNLVMAFGTTGVLEESAHFDELKKLYPNARIVMGTTSGEIHPEGDIQDDTIAATAMSFDKTEVRGHEVKLEEHGGDSFAAGKALAEAMDTEGLAHVLVISDGHQVNGTVLSEGLNQNLPDGISVTGGLAGDGSRFEKTMVGLDHAPAPGHIAAIGLYGKDIRIAFGSMGGWDPFGAVRKVTRVEGNVLYELDGENALELYKKYLGDQAEGLPGTGLLFPLAIINDEGDDLVRTILAVDEATGSMTFAGDIPEGAKVQLMRANFDRLIDGAGGAAGRSHESLNEDEAEVALLISCVGRRLVLGPRTEEEIDEVRDTLGDNCKVMGFYSYGEICPTVGEVRCSLHNQTMTITTLREAA